MENITDALLYPYSSSCCKRQIL